MIASDAVYNLFPSIIYSAICLYNHFQIICENCCYFIMPCRYGVILRTNFSRYIEYFILLFFLHENLYNAEYIGILLHIQNFDLCRFSDN